MTIRAKYEDGVFKPLGAVTLSEGTLVEVHVPVRVGHPEQRRRAL
jgi:predicted DNA-binding antitoxin AbrB/MazE fold protein